MSKTSELDEIFGTQSPSVNKAAKPKKSPAQVVAELQKNLNILAKSFGATPVDLSKPVVKSTANSRRVRIVKFDPVTKRAMTRTDPLADENLGTTTARAVRKSEDDVDLYGGFVSKGQITGDEN